MRSRRREKEERRRVGRGAEEEQIEALERGLEFKGEDG